jgi:hypothetical protein
VTEVATLELTGALNRPIGARLLEGSCDGLCCSSRSSVTALVVQVQSYLADTGAALVRCRSWPSVTYVPV